MIVTNTLMGPRDCYPPLWCLTHVVGLTRADISRVTGIHVVKLQRFVDGGNPNAQDKHRLVDLLLKAINEMRDRPGSSEALKHFNSARRRYSREIHRECLELL